jgi:hypothetical protein
MTLSIWNEKKKPNNSTVTEHPVDYRYRYKYRACNICGAVFRERSRFDRYCEYCRNDDEMYRFADLGA